MPAQFRERRDGQVFAHGKTVEQLIDLVAFGEAELADVGHRHAGDVATLEQDLPGGRRHFAGQHLEERGLAGAVRADDAAHLAVIDREVDVAVGGKTAIALGQAAACEDRTVLRSVSRRRAGMRRPRVARGRGGGGRLLVLGGHSGDRRFGGRLGLFSARRSSSA